MMWAVEYRHEPTLVVVEAQVGRPECENVGKSVMVQVEDLDGWALVMPAAPVCLLCRRVLRFVDIRADS
jgi:hypothetical protein